MVSFNLKIRFSLNEIHVKRQAARQELIKERIASDITRHKRGVALHEKMSHAAATSSSTRQELILCFRRLRQHVAAQFVVLRRRFVRRCRQLRGRDLRFQGRAR